MKGTTKRLMALLGMLALMLAASAPVALAQEEAAQYGGGEVSATGVLVGELPADVAANGTHSISDEATGELYALRSAGADLDSHVGERVTVYGTLTPGQGPAPGQEFGGSLPLIDVSRVEPADNEPGPRIVEATGVLGEPYTPGEDPTPVYDLTDEATGTTYTLFDVGAGLDAFVGQRVTVEGTRSPGIDPLALDVTSVVPAGGSVEDEEIEVSFDLDADCAPPAGTTFYGLAGQQPAALSDPDGDGVYTGSLTLPEGFYAPGPFPIPVWIASGTPEVPNQQIIKSFGEMVLEDGDAFSSSVACDGDGATPIGGGTTSGTVVGGGNGGSGGTDNGSGNAVVSGGGDNADKKGGVSPGVDGNGSVDASDGEKAAEISGSAPEGSASPIASVLPATGGILPIAGAAGALLIGGGLLARRIFR